MVQPLFHDYERGEIYSHEAVRAALWESPPAIIIRNEIEDPARFQRKLNEINPNDYQARVDILAGVVDLEKINFEIQNWGTLHDREIGSIEFFQESRGHSQCHIDGMEDVMDISFGTVGEADWRVQLYRPNPGTSNRDALKAGGEFDNLHPKYDFVQGPGDMVIVPEFTRHQIWSRTDRSSNNSLRIAQVFRFKHQGEEPKVDELLKAYGPREPRKVPQVVPGR